MQYTHFIGVDPGFSGGIAVVNLAATTARVWDMPVSHAKGMKDSQREIDLSELATIFRSLSKLPAPHMVIEWPTTRPGEGAERAERFGRGKGYLHAFAYLLKMDFKLVAPQTWKGRLGLPGKGFDPHSAVTRKWWASKYPQWEQMVLGPRGGVLDGRLDSLVLAEYARMGSVQILGWKGGKKPPTYGGMLE